MILRSWTGHAPLDDPEAYASYLLDVVRPQLDALVGFRGLWLLRRPAEASVEYRVMTLWDSMEAIRAFAGDEPERAVVEPGARAVLAFFDSTVRHYEVLAAPPGTPPV
jgi:heme-degrading monooxygenase HmoA